MVRGYLCESFNSRLRDEFLNLETFTSTLEARVLSETWRRDYNDQRPHERSATGRRNRCWIKRSKWIHYRCLDSHPKWPKLRGPLTIMPLPPLLKSQTIAYRRPLLSEQGMRAPLIYLLVPLAEMSAQLSPLSLQYTGLVQQVK